MLKLLEELEQLVEREGKLHLFGKVLIDEEKFFVLLNKIRVALPDDLRRATELTQQQERVIEQAQQKAREIVEKAREEAAKLTARDEIVRRAEEQARQILQRAEEQARRVRENAEKYAQETRRAADDYAREVLEKLKAVIAKATAAIEEGLRELAASGESKERRA